MIGNVADVNNDECDKLQTLTIAIVTACCVQLIMMTMMITITVR